MKLLQETSEWKVPTPNHTYIFDGSSSKAVGYIKEGTTTGLKFVTPMGFDKRRRTFNELKRADVKRLGLDLSAFA